MASIIKRKSKYSVVYRYTDENGVERQKWETYATNAEAKRRKAEVEYQQNMGTFSIPTTKTVRELLEVYVSIYGLNTWALSTYEAKTGLINNYINPILGDIKLSAITPKVMDKYYKDLLTVKCAPRPYQTQRNDEFVSPRNVQEIHKIIHCAFNQAVKWELMPRNPADHASLPAAEHAKREIWTADILFKAISLCDDDMLSLALNLAFACSLRMGEMLGLTWDCVHIDDKSIAEGTSSVYIEKELQRVSKAALEKLDGKGVIRVFPGVMSSKHTVLVLKEPKSKTSVRTVYLPKTVAEMLIQHKKEQDELMELLGSEYIDYNLVFASPNGRPVEGQIINRAFSKLIKDNDLPKVVFHSLRHSSITYKLKLNGGDMKSVQGDSGHAQLKMVSDVYSHIIDEDRCKNAQNLEKAFYSGQITNEPAPILSEDDKEKLFKLLLDTPGFRERLMKDLETIA